MANAVRKIKEKLFAEITGVPELLQQPHLPSLDGLRGLSIIMVLIFHVELRRQEVFFNGVFGVNIFFVISGFIITTLLLKEKINKGGIALNKFYIRRFLKIFPVAYLYLAVVALLNLYYRFNTKQELIAAALFLKNTTIIATFIDWTTGHFWSLSVEEQFYLVFPFLLKKSTNSYLVIIVLLALLIPVLLFFEARGVKLLNYKRVHQLTDFFRFIIPILIGALFSLLLFKKVIIKRLYPDNLAGNLVILFLGYATFYEHSPLYIPYCSDLISSLFIASLIINNISYSQGWFFKFLNSKALVKIGLMSYSIYVWQQIFLLKVPWSGAFKYADTVWFNMLALLIISFLSYHFIEQKLLKFKRRFR